MFILQVPHGPLSHCFNTGQFMLPVQSVISVANNLIWCTCADYHSNIWFILFFPLHSEFQFSLLLFLGQFTFGPPSPPPHLQPPTSVFLRLNIQSGAFVLTTTQTSCLSFLSSIFHGQFLNAFDSSTTFAPKCYL